MKTYAPHYCCLLYLIETLCPEERRLEGERNSGRGEVGGGAVEVVTGTLKNSRWLLGVHAQSIWVSV